MVGLLFVPGEPRRYLLAETIMNWRRIAIFGICTVACVYTAAMIDTCAFRSDSLTVLGNKQTPDWQSAETPKSWLENHVDMLGYVSYDGTSTIECSSRIEFDGDSFIADFGDLELENGTYFDEVLATSVTNNIFGYRNRQFTISIDGQIDENGRFHLDTRFNGNSGDTIYEIIHERNRTFRLSVVERTFTNARTCEFRFRLESNGTIKLL